MAIFETCVSYAYTNHVFHALTFFYKKNKEISKKCKDYVQLPNGNTFVVNKCIKMHIYIEA
jgi:hypothetical protein